MKVFLSWSGELSHRVAIALNDWLPNVIQSVTTWVSSADIESGSRWADTLFRELEADQFGIVCLTKSNLNAPWLNFEAGALAKQVTTARVVPFLFEMKTTDMPGNHPLTTLHYTLYPPNTDNREAIIKLVEDINRHETPPLSEQQLLSSFNKFWPDFRSTLHTIATELPLVDQKSIEALPFDQSTVLAELLELARNHERLLLQLGGEMLDTIPRPSISEEVSVLNQILFAKVEELFYAINGFLAIADLTERQEEILSRAVQHTIDIRNLAAALVRNAGVQLPQVTARPRRPNGTRTASQ